MKHLTKTFLVFFLLLHFGNAKCQPVILDILSPTSISGLLDHTEQGFTTGWGLPNLLNPADAILDSIVMMDDGASGSNNSYGYLFPQKYCGCDSAGVMNSNVDFENKIVLISRGTCQFGWKAYLAQLRGAKGVIVYNAYPDSDPSGGLVTMLAGDYGALVNIPSAFVGNGDGLMIKALLDNSTEVTAFLGAKIGAFPNDLALYSEKALTPGELARPYAITTDSVDYQVPIEFWITNDGSSNQTNAFAEVNILFNGNSVYNHQITNIGLNGMGDSIFVSFPTFKQPTYAKGHYQFIYSTGIPNAFDDFNEDNSLVYDVYVNDSIFSFARVDSTLTPIDNRSYRPASFSYWASGIHFSHPNASSLQLDGIRFAGQIEEGDSLTGTLLDIVVYEWTDSFFGLNDPNLSMSSLNGTPLLSELFVFTSESQNDTLVTHKFQSPISLDDSTRYVICIVSSNSNLYLNFSTDPWFGVNDQMSDAQPKDILMIDGTWNENGWDESIPTIQGLFSPNTFGLEDVWTHTNLSPNPANQLVRIEVGQNQKIERLFLLNLDGTLLESFSLKDRDQSLLEIDVAQYPIGSYLLQIELEGGEWQSKRFNISR